MLIESLCVGAALAALYGILNSQARDHHQTLTKQVREAGAKFRIEMEDRIKLSEGDMRVARNVAEERVLDRVIKLEKKVSALEPKSKDKLPKGFGISGVRSSRVVKLKNKAKKKKYT